MLPGMNMAATTAGGAAEPDTRFYKGTIYGINQDIAVPADKTKMRVAAWGPTNSQWEATNEETGDVYRAATGGSAFRLVEDLACTPGETLNVFIDGPTPYGSSVPYAKLRRAGVDIFRVAGAYGSSNTGTGGGDGGGLGGSGFSGGNGGTTVNGPTPGYGGAAGTGGPGGPGSGTTNGTTASCEVFVQTSDGETATAGPGAGQYGAGFSKQGIVIIQFS